MRHGQEWLTPVQQLVSQSDETTAGEAYLLVSQGLLEVTRCGWEWLAPVQLLMSQSDETTLERLTPVQ